MQFWESAFLLRFAMNIACMGKVQYSGNHGHQTFGESELYKRLCIIAQAIFMILCIFSSALLQNTATNVHML